MKKKKVLFISSTGGHFNELQQLRPLFEKYNYHKELGTITIFDKQLMSDLYSEYHNLGGNGVITDLMEEVNSLPISNDYSVSIKKTIPKE